MSDEAQELLSRCAAEFPDADQDDKWMGDNGMSKSPTVQRIVSEALRAARESGRVAACDWLEAELERRDESNGENWEHRRAGMSLALALVGRARTPR